MCMTESIARSTRSAIYRNQHTNQNGAIGVRGGPRSVAAMADRKLSRSDGGRAFVERCSGLNLCTSILWSGNFQL
jgi:hypothetical protein